MSHMKPTSLPCRVFCRTVHLSETATYVVAKVLEEYSRIFFSWLRLDDARRSPAATQSCMLLQARQGLASLRTNTGRIESNEGVCKLVAKCCELGGLRSNGFGWFWMVLVCQTRHLGCLGSVGFGVCHDWQRSLPWVPQHFTHAAALAQVGGASCSKLQHVQATLESKTSRSR